MAVLLTALAAVGTAVSAAVDDAAMTDPDVRRVLESTPIHIRTSGRTDVEVSTLSRGLENTNLLVDAQQTYARMLPAGKQPQFVIMRSSSNTYYYVNDHGERTNIREVARRQVGQDCLRCVYHVTGRRFFGPFESVIQVDVRQSAAGATQYDIDVYAHPEVTVTRFMARHLPFVDRYFQGKTRDVVQLAARVVNASVTVGTTPGKENPK